MHFGLGRETAVSAIEIHWPSGALQLLKDQAADRILRIEEPEQAAPRLRPVNQQIACHIGGPKSPCEPSKLQCVALPPCPSVCKEQVHVRGIPEDDWAESVVTPLAGFAAGRLPHAPG